VLSADQAVAIEQAELADVVPGPTAGTWYVRTGSKVGVVLGDDWELRVRPHLSVPGLMFLLGYSRDQRGWRRDIAEFEEEDDLLAAIASGFSWHAIWALERGALRGYIRHDERRHDLRGRVLFGEQLSRGGLPLPVHLTYDEFTEDVLENRILRTATQLLLRLQRVPIDARRRLLRIRALLEHVPPLSEWRGVTAPPPNRLNERYAPALRLAELVLSSASLSLERGATRSTTFVFDMNKVFEDFVTVAFREAMRPYGGQVRDQVTPYSLDEDHELKLKPDLSWWNDGRCLAVLDAKYKAIDDGVMKHPDAYQMLAYCTAYNLRRGYLVYAKDSGLQPRTHVVRHSDHEIVVIAVDVEAERAELTSSIRELAACVAADYDRVAVAS
jgi:5-methylcytosine-specific restriction enzyme subunit McrC